MKGDRTNYGKGRDHPLRVTVRLYGEEAEQLERLSARLGRSNADVLVDIYRIALGANLREWLGKLN